MQKFFKKSLSFTNTCGETSRNAFPNQKPGAKSQNLRLKPEPEVVLAAILDSEGAKSYESAFIQCRMTVD